MSTADRSSSQPEQPVLERLQKVLAHAGVCARRECEQWILEGRVAVNGTVVTQLGTKVGPDDAITVDGRLVQRHAPTVVFVLNKPRGYLSTVVDPHGRPTVLDLVATTQRVYPVGRLDYDSEGLLLLTNDGELTHRLLHPRYELEKEYRVLVTPEPTTEQLRRLREGVVVDGQRTLPARVEIERRDKGGAWLRFVLREGRKRQIRRMCAAVRLKVHRLIRVRIGPLRLGTLPPGRFRLLDPVEIAGLRRAVGLS